MANVVCGAADALQCIAGTEGDFPFPIISDAKRNFAVQLGMIDPSTQDDAGIPLPARAVCVSAGKQARSLHQVFVIGTDRKVKLSILYPATTGRNFEFV